MQRRALFLLLAAVLTAPLAFGANSANASSDIIEFTKPIVFAPGSDQVVIRRTLGFFRAHVWVITGRPGQRVTIALRTKGPTFLVLYDKKGGSKPSWDWNRREGHQLRSWTGMLPKSGRIKIEISGSSEGGARYELLVKRG
jgi:hypothetical protein